MYKHTLSGFLTFLLLPFMAVSVLHGDEFYKGKTLKLVVGYSPSSSYHQYAHLIAKHMKQHLGAKQVVVRSMPGAGSLKAANFIAKKAKADGLTVGIWDSAWVLREALGDKRAEKHDVKHQKLGWVGATSKATLVCVFTRSKSVDDVLRESIKMGALKNGTYTVHLPEIMNKVLGTKFEVKADYESVPKIVNRMQSGEVGGFCATRRVVAMLSKFSKKRLVALFHRTWDDPRVENFPTLWKAYLEKMGKERDEKALAIIQGYLGHTLFMYPVAAPPGTPPDRLATLRDAFAKTVQDSVLLAEAKRRKLMIHSIKGEEVENQVERIFGMSDEVKKDLALLVLRR